MLWENAISRMDPPAHTRIRRKVSCHFSRRQAESIRSEVRCIVDEVFNQQGRSVDLVRSLSLPVPMKVLCRLLGLNERDWGDLEGWTNEFLNIFQPGLKTQEQSESISNASQHFVEFIGHFIDEKVRGEKDSLVGRLLTDQAGGASLSREELIGAVRGLITAGYETTAGTISAMCVCFANRPELVDELRENQSLIPRAVEEILRWETPVQLTTRYLGNDIVLHGERLTAGTAIGLLLGAANRDPDVFKEPDRVELHREAADHLSFGGGRHFCLGAYLARVELQEVAKAIAVRWRRIDMDPEKVTRRPNFQFRTIMHLPASPVWL